MISLDQARRAVVVLLVAVCLLLVPSVATARFGDSRAAALPVGTDRMETPSAVSGTYRCAFPFFYEGIEVSVDSFVDAGPAGATYDYTLTGPGRPRTTSSTSDSAWLSSGSVRNDGEATAWTLTIRSRLGSWTGTPYTRTITCPRFFSDDGSL